MSAKQVAPHSEGHVPSARATPSPLMPLPPFVPFGSNRPVLPHPENPKQSSLVPCGVCGRKIRILNADLDPERVAGAITCSPACRNEKRAEIEAVATEILAAHFVTSPIEQPGLLAAMLPRCPECVATLLGEEAEALLRCGNLIDSETLLGLSKRAQAL